MSVESRPPADASIAELMTQLSTQTTRLVRDEMRLAQKEFQESAKRAGIGAGLIGAAGLLAVLGLATLIAAGVAALSLVLEVWAAALIVAVVIFAVAGVMALMSKKQVKQATPAVPRTTESVKADIQQVKGRAPMTTNHDRGEPGPDSGVDDIQADIDQTRQELGQTVEALTAKLDVKQRTRQAAADTKDRVVEKAQTTVSDPRIQRGAPIAAAVLVAAIVGIVILRRRRR